METIRHPAVAGFFYPGDPGDLARQVDSLLEAVPQEVLPRSSRNGASDSRVPNRPYARAISAPHAGYVYSGATAAYAYRQLDPATRRVLILGPTHRVGIRGMALTGADWQETPLGRIRTDGELTAKLAALPDVVTAPRVHAEEHSMEVHMPFLQRYLKPGFTVVPLAVGVVEPEVVAAAIRLAWNMPDTAILISSDMSHYLEYDAARATDGKTIRQILAGAPALVGEQACGAFPLSGMMAFAAARGLTPELLDARNSGDTAGDHSRVVGYAAFRWNEPVSPPDQTLPRLAYESIASAFGNDGGAVGNNWQKTSDADGGPSAALAAPGATFVTLTLDGRLRGCIGSLAARRPLGEDVAANARAAAFEDPRFPELTEAELKRADIEVSVLTEPRPMKPEDPVRGLTREEVERRLLPGFDGAVLTYGAHRGTFLPQVWNQLPQPYDFVSGLLRKAGLPSDWWDPAIEVETYRVQASHLLR